VGERRRIARLCFVAQHRKAVDADGGVTDYSSGYMELPPCRGSVGETSWSPIAARIECIASMAAAIERSSPGTARKAAAVTASWPSPRVWMVCGVCGSCHRAYFLCTHRGKPGVVRGYRRLHIPLPNGYRSDTHTRRHVFYNRRIRVSECRAVTVDWRATLLSPRNDNGYVRRVRFLHSRHDRAAESASSAEPRPGE